MARETDITTSTAEQASHWWEVFHGDDASAADHREFGEWVARSPERVQAYLETAQLLQALKAPAIRWPDTSAAELVRAAKASPQEPLRIGAGRAAPRESSAFGGQRVRAAFAFGLAAALLVGMGLTWLRWASPQQFETRFGEQRSVLLEDGSRVTLNTASKIEVTLHKNHRLVRLVQGEALFEVAHDPTRPFDVQADRSVLRAVGTQFDVDVRPSRTTVTVVEGRVALMTQAGSDATDSGGEFPVLVAADRLVITPTGAGALKHGINVGAAISWTQRQLVFEHRPLGEVAEEFNRYNHDRISIESAELRGQEITGVFQSNDATSFVSFLSSIPGVEIQRDARGGHIVTLDGKEPAAK